MKRKPVKPKSSSFPRKRESTLTLHGAPTMDDSQHPRLFLRATTGSAVESRFANARFGILRSQSRVHGNDGTGGFAR
ncbi:MAG TPA: hypothetical protein VGH81_11945 [Rudaea sp.]|jgi:hypothetical protein